VARLWLGWRWLLTDGLEWGRLECELYHLAAVHPLHELGFQFFCFSLGPSKTAIKLVCAEPSALRAIHTESYTLRPLHTGSRKEENEAALIFDDDITLIVGPPNYNKQECISRLI